MDLTLFGLRPNKSKTIRQKNLKKIKFYHVGLLIILINSHKAVKQPHFIVKSIFKSFSGWTRSHDAYARFSPIYNIVFSPYTVRRPGVISCGPKHYPPPGSKWLEKWYQAAHSTESTIKTIENNSVIWFQHVFYYKRLQKVFKPILAPWTCSIQ
jgi:hypothetical protein